MSKVPPPSSAVAVFGHGLPRFLLGGQLSTCHHSKQLLPVTSLSNSIIVITVTSLSNSIIVIPVTSLSNSIIVITKQSDEIYRDCVPDSLAGFGHLLPRLLLKEEK
jgi:hypothetical protein